jgi:hypothetical protein
MKKAWFYISISGLFKCFMYCFEYLRSIPITSLVQSIVIAVAAEIHYEMNSTIVVAATAGGAGAGGGVDNNAGPIIMLLLLWI